MSRPINHASPIRTARIIHCQKVIVRAMLKPAWPLMTFGCHGSRVTMSALLLLYQQARTSWANPVRCNLSGQSPLPWQRTLLMTPSSDPWSWPPGGSRSLLQVLTVVDDLCQLPHPSDTTAEVLSCHILGYPLWATRTLSWHYHVRWAVPGGPVVIHHTNGHYQGGIDQVSSIPRLQACLSLPWDPQGRTLFDLGADLHPLSPLLSPCEMIVQASKAHCKTRDPISSKFLDFIFPVSVSFPSDSISSPYYGCLSLARSEMLFKKCLLKLGAKPWISDLPVHLCFGNYFFELFIKNHQLKCSRDNATKN